MLLCAVCYAESNMEGIFRAFLLKYKLHETKHNFQPRKPFQEALLINKDNLLGGRGCKLSKCYL